MATIMMDILASWATALTTMTTPIILTITATTTMPATTTTKSRSSRRGGRCAALLRRGHRAARDHDLDAPIARAAFGRGVVRDRTRRRKPFRVDARRGHFRSDQIVAHGNCAPRRQLLVGLIGAGAVRVAFDLELEVRIRRHDAREAGEALTRRGTQIRGARRELHAADLRHEPAIGFFRRQ